MTLVTPRAGLTAGRSADIRVSGTGGAAAEAIAGLGDTINQVGQRIEADRLDREATRAQIEMTRALGEARQQFEQMNDPDAIDQGWPKKVDELRASLLDGAQADGRPAIDPKIRERVGLAFDELAVRHGLALGRVALQARKTQRAANWLEYSGEVTRQAGSADPDTRKTLLDQADQIIEADLKSGAIDDLEAARRRKEIRTQADGAAAIVAVSQDPRGFLEDVRKGHYSGLPAETLSRFRVQAKSALDRAAASEARDAEARAKERQKAVDSRLKEMTDILDAGRVPADLAVLNTPEAKASPEYGRAMAALQLQREMADLPFRTPAELDALIAEEKKRPIVRKWQNERLEVLTRARDESLKGWQSDPLAHAAKIGMKVPELPDPASSDVNAYAQGLVRRLAFSDFLQEKGYISDPAFFSSSERDALKNALDPAADPARRAELANALALTVGGRNPGILQSISGDRVLAWAGGMMSSGVSEELAAEMLRGEQVMAEKGIVMPPLKERIDPAFEMLGPVFDGLPGGEKLRGDVVAAADALYAARQSRIDPAAGLDADLYRQALHEVMGGQGAYDSAQATGGVQEVEGRMLILPDGVRAADAERALDRLRRITALDGLKAGGRSNRSEPIWKSVSDGQVPYVGGKPMADGVAFPHTQLQAVGDDRYRLIFRAASGRRYYVEDQHGKPFTFSLRRLIEATPK